MVASIIDEIFHISENRKASSPGGLECRVVDRPRNE